MDHLTCGSGARWCARADAMFNVPGIHMLDVEARHRGRLVLSVESGQREAGCPSCGVLSVGHGRRIHVLHDAPCLGRVALVRWRKRVGRCREPLCPTDTFFRAARPRAASGGADRPGGAVGATDALTHDDTTVSPLARHRGVDWHTAWSALPKPRPASAGPNTE
jgi:transposase